MKDLHETDRRKRLTEIYGEALAGRLVSFPAADWARWCQVEQVTAAEAIALSLDCEPGCGVEQTPAYERRRALVAEHVGERVTLTIGARGVMLDLAQFAAWCRDQGGYVGVRVFGLADLAPSPDDARAKLERILGGLKRGASTKAQAEEKREEIFAEADRLLASGMPPRSLAKNIALARPELGVQRTIQRVLRARPDPN